MNLLFNRRKKIGKGTSLNVSKRGVSVSQKVGPFSISKSGVRIRLGKGFSIKL